ncbi:GTP-binding protein [Thermopetrobacter sp. TC1]|uniref:CobW family GTP-binding protein n=1 Tax=Thermopetrobacter sp. TC1 TaxID=1495045 RepID=UPI0018CDE9B8|nr:GTP-binding protein [Thermopetrobacter sp. TC1]
MPGADSALPPDHRAGASIPDDPLPFSVITGFLGAGKTTLLNRLLSAPEMQGTLVIVNEFGEASLDHLLIETTPGEVIELASGCMCCTLRGDLVETLIDVLHKAVSGALPRLNRIIVETSGLADPAPILHTIMAHPWLLQRLRLEAVIALFDALTGEISLRDHVEVRRQLAIADRIVVSKIDLLPPGQKEAHLSHLGTLLKGAAPHARIIFPEPDALSFEALFDAALFDAKTGTVRLHSWLPQPSKTEQTAAHTHDHTHAHTFVLDHDAPMSLVDVDILVDLFRANFGPDLLRLKGIIHVREDPEHPLVIHGVQHIFHPPARLPAWPGNNRYTRIVGISLKPIEDAARKLFTALTDPLRGGGKAMTDQTLSTLPDGD